MCRCRHSCDTECGCGATCDWCTHDDYDPYTDPASLNICEGCE